MSGTRREFHWHFFPNDELTSQLERLEQELRTRTEQIVASDAERPPESADVVYERDVRRAVDDLFRRSTDGPWLTPRVAGPYSVFVSYAREDERYAVEVYTALQEADVRTFIAVQAIQPGDDWENVIRGAIARCRYCLCILTRHALASEWCAKEIAMAHHQKGAAVFPAYRLVSVDEAESAFPELKGIQGMVLETEEDKRRIVQRA